MNLINEWAKLGTDGYVTPLQPGDDPDLLAIGVFSSSVDQDGFVKVMLLKPYKHEQTYYSRCEVMCQLSLSQIYITAYVSKGGE